MALTPITIDVLLDEVDEQTDTNSTDVQAQQPAKTWRIDLESGRIGGFIDGERAVRQYVTKALMTARNRYLIYDDTYGEELRDLVGQNASSDLLTVELPRLLREALIYSDYINDVTDVNIVQHKKDGLHITFTVVAANGDEIKFDEVVI